MQRQLGEVAWMMADASITICNIKIFFQSHLNIDLHLSTALANATTTMSLKKLPSNWWFFSNAIYIKRIKCSRILSQDAICLVLQTGRQSVRFLDRSVQKTHDGYTKSFFKNWITASCTMRSEKEQKSRALGWALSFQMAGAQMEKGMR